MIGLALAAIVALSAWNAPAAAPQMAGRDCEIRDAYSDTLSTTEIWLTLEPRTTDGKPAPPGVVLTFTARFAGRRPTRPATEVEARANVGLMWAPRPEMLLDLDGDKIDLDAKVPPIGSDANGGFSYVVSTISTRLLEQMANAKRLTGSVLGLQVEFTDAQRDALRKFFERVTSTSPSSPTPACAP